METWAIVREKGMDLLVKEEERDGNLGISERKGGWIS
jgi:hypothetical protein